jgi:hypothetical protein
MNANNTNSAIITGNTAIGYESLRGGAGAANNTGTANTAVGYQTLALNTTGSANVAVGHSALINNGAGADNVAVGVNALNSNTTGGANVGIGVSSLGRNTTGVHNVSIGYYALSENTAGNRNNAYGSRTLRYNTGSDNNAFGEQALYSNTGDGNIAMGGGALYGNTTGSNNVGIGGSAMGHKTTGSNNVAVGILAGEKIADGVSTNSSSDNSVFLGFQSYPQSAAQTNQIVIGYNAIGNGSNSTVIGNASTTSAEIKGALKTNGQLLSLSTKTSAYNILSSDEIILANASSAAFSVTLPTAVDKNGQTYTIKRMNSGSNDVTLATTSSQTIDGLTTYVLSAQYKYIKVVSDGSNWVIVGNN